MFPMRRVGVSSNRDGVHVDRATHGHGSDGARESGIVRREVGPGDVRDNSIVPVLNGCIPGARSPAAGSVSIGRNVNRAAIPVISSCGRVRRGEMSEKRTAEDGGGEGGVELGIFFGISWF